MGLVTGIDGEILEIRGARIGFGPGLGLGLGGILGDAGGQDRGWDWWDGAGIGAGWDWFCYRTGRAWIGAGWDRIVLIDTGIGRWGL